MLVALCENKNVDTGLKDEILSYKEGEMSKGRKFVAIVRGDKKLLGMFSGIVFDITALLAILILAVAWYLP